MQETNVVFNPTFVTLKFNVLTSVRTSISSKHSTICAILVEVTSYGTWRGIDEKIPPVLHEIGKEDSGLEFALKGLRSLLFINAWDFEGSFLHVIFDLKGVIVGKEYISINHLLFMPYNIDHFPTLLNKRVITRWGLK
jgi:hypothetical protein